jgi:XTP/dITP diphosphohydrolase
MGPVVVATANPHKLRELGEALPELDLEPLPAGVELPTEGEESFAANALTKARAASAATGGPAIADDSGIEAAALGGRPGVLSARFAGPGASDEQNLAKLIAELDGSEDRGVAYVCALAFVDADGAESVFEGRCGGTLIAEPRGEGGFGYDPAFLPDDTGPDDERTMAELAPHEKHAISHRGRAARKLAEHVHPARTRDRHPRRGSRGGAGR